MSVNPQRVGKLIGDLAKVAELQTKLQKSAQPSASKPQPQPKSKQS